MIDPPPPTGPPPGWYPDPTTKGRGFRWWDGVAWTDQWTEHPEAIPDGLSPVGEWMNELLRLVRSRAGHFFPMIVLLLVPITLLNGLAAWYAFRDVVVTTDSNGNEFGVTDPGGSAAGYGLALGTFLALVVASVALVVVAARQTQASLDEEGEPWSESMVDGLSRLPRALGLTALILGVLVVLYLGMAITTAITPVLLVVTVPVWLVATVWFSARFSLIAVAAALAPATTSCLRMSWTLTTSNVRAIVGRMALLTLFSVSLALFMRLVSSLVVEIVGGTGTEPIEPGSGEIRFADLVGDNPAIFAIGQLFGALGNGFALVLWAAGFVLVYRDLSGPREEA